MSNVNNSTLSVSNNYTSNNDANRCNDIIHNNLHYGTEHAPTKSSHEITEGDTGNVLSDSGNKEHNEINNAFLLSRQDTGLECRGDEEYADTTNTSAKRHADTTNTSAKRQANTEPHDDGNVKNKNTHYYRNRDKILAYAKIRYKENREKLLSYSKQYQSERKDRVKERNDEYYAKNKEALLKKRGEKITCKCGKTITRGSISGHIKTKYHLKHLEKNDEKTNNEELETEN